MSTIKRMLSDPRNGNTGALNKQETNLQSKKIKEDMYVDKTKKKKKGNPEGIGCGPIKYLPSFLTRGETVPSHQSPQSPNVAFWCFSLPLPFKTEKEKKRLLT